MLIADEDPVRRLMLYDLLSRAGFAVVVCESGMEAIRELRPLDHPPLAILSENLRGMGGREICERMRDAAKEVYLILNCERVTSDILAAGLDAGADHVSAASAPEVELLAYVKAGLRAVVRRQVATQ